MVITENGLNFAKEKALNLFDNVEYIAIGNSDNVENPNDTTLGNELVRDPIDLKVKDITNNKYDFEGKFELSDASGKTIKEVGLFDDVTAGNMLIRKVLPMYVDKDTTAELIIGVRVNVNAINKEI